MFIYMQIPLWITLLLFLVFVLFLHGHKVTLWDSQLLWKYLPLGRSTQWAFQNSVVLLEQAIFWVQGASFFVMSAYDIDIYGKCRVKFQVPWAVLNVYPTVYSMQRRDSNQVLLLSLKNYPI